MRRHCIVFGIFGLRELEEKRKNETRKKMTRQSCIHICTKYR